jgi:iron complex outermembrane receptor protein
VVLPFLLLLAAPLAAQVAQGTLTGTVVDPSGEVVPGGAVRLLETRHRTTAGADGKFTLAGIPAGTYLLQVESLTAGNGLLRVEVEAGETTEVEVVLDRITVTDSVVVTASPEVRSQLEVAQPTSVLTGEELELRVAGSLGETLSSQPGVSSTYFGPGASRPVIRGLGGDRVRILEGGIGTADASSTSPDHAVASDPLGADRIEVLRGPATLLYGSSAVGGVVNVLDGRIPNVVPESKISGTVELVGGSVADERTGAVSLEGGGGRWAWHADALRRDTDDYDVPGFADLDGAEEGEEPGILENSAVESESGAFGVSWVGERSYFGVAVSGFDTLYGVPGGHAEEEGEEEPEPGEEEEEEGPIRIDLEQRRIDLKGEVQTSGDFLRGVRVRLGVNEYEHRELEGDEIGTTFTNDGLEGRLELIQRRRGNLSGSFGLQVVDSDFAAVGEEAFVPPSTTTSWAAFVFEELERGTVRYQFGARYETQDNDPEGVDLTPRSFSGVSGSFGAVVEISPEYTFTASLARTERLPTSTELYAAGPHIATGNFELGDPSLDKEESLGLDLSLRKRTGRLTGVLNLFANRFDDYIFEEFTGDEEDGLPVVAFVQRDAEFKGAELDAVVNLTRWGGGHLDLLLSGDYVEAELRSTGLPLPRIPPLRYGTGLSVHAGPFRGFAEVRRVEEQDEVGVNETPTDGYTLVNAAVTYRLLAGGFVTDLQLKGTNLTDEEARSHTSFLKEVAPLPGRDLQLALRFRF